MKLQLTKVNVVGTFHVPFARNACKPLGAKTTAESA